MVSILCDQVSGVSKHNYCITGVENSNLWLREVHKRFQLAPEKYIWLSIFCDLFHGTDFLVGRGSCLEGFSVPEDFTPDLTKSTGPNHPLSSPFLNLNFSSRPLITDEVDGGITFKLMEEFTSVDQIHHNRHFAVIRKGKWKEIVG